MNTPDMNGPEIVPVDFANVMDDWLGGAAIAQTSVVIYGKPSLIGRYEDLARQREVVEKSLQAEGTLSSPQLTAIDEELETLYNEWMASKSTWYLRGLTEEERDEIQKATPVTPDPEPLPKGANPGQIEWHAEALAEAAKKREEVSREENYRVIVAALVKVEFADGRTAESVTVEQMRGLHKKLGDLQLSKLARGVALATAGDLELPAPFSLRTSQTDQT